MEVEGVQGYCIPSVLSSVLCTDMDTLLLPWLSCLGVTRYLRAAKASDPKDWEYLVTVFPPCMATVMIM